MSKPCQVDFYVLQDESLSVEILACRLALMAWEHRNRIFVLVKTESQRSRLDDLMWEQPQGRFLPHTSDKQMKSSPVLIGMLAQLDHENREVLINLTEESVDQPERFKRLLELVPANPVQRQHSREKFKWYREQGLEPVSHPISSNNASER